MAPSAWPPAPPLQPLAHFGRFALHDGTVVYARVEGEQLRLLSDAPWLGGQTTSNALPTRDTHRLCPVQPSKIVCIGRNYKEHAQELGQSVPSAPLLFLKAPSSLLEPEGTVLLPPESQRVEHEAELGVVIGRRARRVSVADALLYVYGYTIVADVTARDLQQTDGQWTRSKSFDTFCPVGPDVVTGINPAALSIRGYINGVARQSANTRQMIFPVHQLVSYISQSMTLEPGDLIATGTPEGVGVLRDGDLFEVDIEQVGRLRVHVAVEPAKDR